MPILPRTALRAKSSASSKEQTLPSGKENERPSSSANTVTNRKVIVPKRRASVCSNDERKKKLIEVAGRSCQPILAPVVAGLFPSKKTQFRVHCDEKIVPQPHRGYTVEPTRFNDSIPSKNDPVKLQSTLLFGKVRQPSRKRTPYVVPRDNKKLLPSKIPRLVSNTESTTRNDRTVVLKQVESSLVVGIEKLGCAAGGVDRRNIPTARPKSTSTPKGVESCRIADANSAIVDFRDIRSNTRLRRSKSTGHEPQEKEDTPAKKPSKVQSSFASQLTCNADYHADLPIVEGEREDRAPQLSANFLKDHVNGEQREIVVAFLLHLGIHCGYSSLVIYQAVKLFDVAIDKIPVDVGFLQLTALGSLWIALKTRANTYKIPTASTMINLAKDLYAGREDLLMSLERKILWALNFYVSFADAYSLLSYHLINYKRCTDVSQETFEFIYHAGGYVIDLTLLDEEFCRTPVRLVALTAAELVLGVILDNADETDELPKSPRWLFWRGLLYGAGVQPNYRFQDEEIDQCRVAMLRRVLMSGRKNYRFAVVYKKYSRSRYGRIAESFLSRASIVPMFETFDP